MKTSKSPGDSRTEYNIIVHPADANSLGACFGGAILQWMDMAASICARRHSNTRVNTVKAESIEFLKPLKIGNVAHIVANVVRTFSSSMEVHIQVYAENTYTATSVLAATAVFVFAALDEKMKPMQVNKLIPESAEEKALWENAGHRRKNQKQNRKI